MAEKKEYSVKTSGKKLKKPYLFYDGNNAQIKTEYKGGTPIEEIKPEHKDKIKSEDIE